MEAPLLLALARLQLRRHPELPLDGAWASNRALGLVWGQRGGKEAWVLLTQPRPELWRLPVDHPAYRKLAAEAPKDSGKAWGAWLQGARLREVQGDPRERWLGLLFQRRAFTGRLETVRIAFQAIPGRAGVRLDGQDVQVPRLGLGSPFPAQIPAPEGEPPPYRRWVERFGADLEAALAGERPEAMDGEGEDLEARHRAWSLKRAEELILGPALAAARRALDQERDRLERLAGAVAEDRAKHQARLAVKPRAQALAAELYRLKGESGTVRLLDGTALELPEALRAEDAVQHWFGLAKKAERGLQHVGELERDLARQRRAWEAKREAFEQGEPAPGSSPRLASKDGAKKPKEKGRVKEKDPKVGKRADGKGAAFRSVGVDGFEVLIGKGDAENDQLTFRVADNHDVWMHVANLPGSHVVVRNPDRLSELPRHVLERAAELAAYHSKARDAGKVEVHVARISDISKPKGFAPGKVILKKWTSVRVYPKP